MGIDPGTTKIGFGVVEKQGNKLACLDYGIIKNQGKDKPGDYKNTAKKISEIIAKYSPDLSSVEKLFMFKNQKTVMAVSEMRGVIMLTLSNCGLPICEFTPLQVKQAVSSYGRAGKEQVEKMVRLILGLKDKIKPDDAADALAIAICCANSYTPFN